MQCVNVWVGGWGKGFGCICVLVYVFRYIYTLVSIYLYMPAKFTWLNTHVESAVDACMMNSKCFLLHRIDTDSKRDKYAHIHLHTHTHYTHTHKHTHTNILTQRHTHTNTYTHTHMYTHTHTHTQTRTRTLHTCILGSQREQQDFLLLLLEWRHGWDNTCTKGMPAQSCTSKTQQMRSVLCIWR